MHYSLVLTDNALVFPEQQGQTVVERLLRRLMVEPEKIA